ncbi:unannotated protein [freshwater metagenome]|uniref:Unannotated protein n=1 Tax=freshwater metagenome TaxID=449393 RepID=A0A6J6DPN3_9ZZZZ
MYVGLDDQVECCHFTGLNLSENVFQLHAALYACVSALVQHSHALFARFGNNACCLFIRSSTEFIACLRSHRQTQHLYRCGRACFFDLLASFVDKCAHLAPCCAGNNRVTHFECSLVDQNCGNRSTTNVEVCFQHNSFSATVRVCL